MENPDFNTGIEPEPQISTKELLKLENQHRGGANWFFWIAGLSLINTVILIFGGSWNFILGLAATQVIDGFVQAISVEIPNTTAAIVKLIGLGLVLGIAGLFALFGLLARKKYQWAFIIGMILYVLDGLIFLLVGDILSVAFHAFALMALFGGLRALRKLNAIETGDFVISDEIIETSSPVEKANQRRKFWISVLITILIIFVPFFIYLAFLLSY